jgi:hypothetical protein
MWILEAEEAAGGAEEIGSLRIEASATNQSKTERVSDNSAFVANACRGMRCAIVLFVISAQCGSRGPVHEDVQSNTW